MTIDAARLGKDLFLLAYPSQWSTRFSSRPTVAAPIFAEFSNNGQVRLLDIEGGVEPDWLPQSVLGVSREDVVDLDSDVWMQVQTIMADKGAACALCSIANHIAGHNEAWEQFYDQLQADRFSASVWFERDRQNLVLTDSLANADIVTLWDESVSEAIESGYLVPPRGPKARDEEWIPQLVSYAESQGLLSRTPIDLIPPSSERHSGPAE